MGDTGGSLSLAYVLDDNWDAIEADFQRFYGLDLTECVFGEEPLALRRIQVLVSHLPKESMLVQLNSAEDGSVHVGRGHVVGSTAARPAPSTKPRFVTSLSGVDPRQFYSGELTWA